MAVARSLGIPARIEPVARKIQYFKDNAWVDVDFEAAVQTTAKQGKVIASYQPIKALQGPEILQSLHDRQGFAERYFTDLEFRERR